MLEKGVSSKKLDAVQVPTVTKKFHGFNSIIHVLGLSHYGFLVLTQFFLQKVWVPLTVIGNDLETCEKENLI